MAYAQFGYPSYPTSTQMLTVSTGGPVTGGASCTVSSSCSSSGISSPSPQSPPCVEATVSSGPNSACNRASPSPSPPISSASTAVQQTTAYESRLISTAAYHHPSIHSVNHSHQVHPRLTAAGFYGTPGGSSLHASGSGAATISYGTDTSVTSNGYASLASVDSSAFYPTLSTGFGMKDDPWRGTLSSSAHPANAHQTTASYYYDPTLAAYGYGGLDFNGARRKNVTRDSTTTLKAWLGEHRKNPYPTKGEKIMLAIITKMTLTQVSTWFANARRRLKKENKMTWEPRNKVETEDHGDDSQTDSGSRRSEDEERKTKEVILPTKQERLDKDDTKCGGDINMSAELVTTKRNDEYDDRNRLACLGRTHPMDSNDASLYRGRSTIIGNESQNGSRLSTLGLHSGYPGSVINEFSGSCLQLPFSPVPSVPSASSGPFRPHHSTSLMGPDTLIAPSVSQYNGGNRYQVSSEQTNVLTGTSAFTPSTTSSSEGDSQDLLSCNALDAFIKDASLSSTSSGETSSPMGNVDVDNAYSPVITKPKIWSLAATATSKSPPPPTAPNVQIPSCAAKYGDFLPNQPYQKHCLNRETFNYPSCNSDSWYAYPSRQQSNPQFHQGPPAANGHQGFGHRSCYSPSPPQTDTPPQTPPSLKIVGHQLNNYGGVGAPSDHHLYGNYTQHQMGGGPVGGGKAAVLHDVKNVRGSMMCEVPGENSMEKRNEVVSMENPLEHGSGSEVVRGNAEYQRLSLSEEDESSSPCASTSGHRADTVHGVTPLTAYRNCFAAESEFEIP